MLVTAQRDLGLGSRQADGEGLAYGGKLFPEGRNNGLGWGGGLAGGCSNHHTRDQP